MTHVTHPIFVTHLTHDPWPIDPFPALVRLCAKFRLDRFILSPSVGEKHQFLPFFGIRHLAVSPIGGSNLRMLDTSAQLQTFPYQTVSKLFLYFNALMAKSGVQSLSFKSVIDRQTNRQTDRQTDRQTKTQRFWPPQRRVKSEPHQTWRGDRGPRARSCASKTLGGLTHSFAARRRWKFGDNQTAST